MLDYNNRVFRAICLTNRMFGATEVQAQIESYPKLKKMILDAA